jgi:GNAT superfamily N-acetyltransferase
MVDGNADRSRRGPNAEGHRLGHRVGPPTDRLVGFGRVLTDEVYLAVILDVIVAAEWRSLGLGKMILDAIVGHPKLVGVRSLELVCQPDLMPFYGRWGFTDG